MFLVEHIHEQEHENIQVDRKYPYEVDLLIDFVIPLIND